MSRCLTQPTTQCSQGCCPTLPSPSVGSSLASPLRQTLCVRLVSCHVTFLFSLCRTTSPSWSDLGCICLVRCSVYYFFCTPLYLLFKILTFWRQFLKKQHTLSVPFPSLPYPLFFEIKVTKRGTEKWRLTRRTFPSFFTQQKKTQWKLHNCGNTTEATTLLQQFIKKKKKAENHPSMSAPHHKAHCHNR